MQTQMFHLYSYEKELLPMCINQDSEFVAA